MIGLAAIAALALTALVGAGSASAVETTLCKSAVDSPYCEAGDRYAAGTSLKATASSFQIKTTIGTIKCSSTLEGTAQEKGNPLAIQSVSWTLTKCSMSGTNCTASVGGSTSANLAWTSQDDGTLTQPEGTWFVTCGGFTHCTYSVPAITVQGGSPATLSATAVPLKTLGGFLCHAQNDFSATYSVSSPAPAHVAKAEAPPVPTKLCKAAESPCKAENQYPSGTALKSGSHIMTIKTNISTITCNGEIEAETTAAQGAPLPVKVNKFPLTGCNWAGIGACSVTEESHSPFTLKWITGTQGFFQGSVLWNFKCGATVECAWELAENIATFSGGNPATITWNLVKLAARSGTFCTTSAEMTFAPTLTTPKPVYVSIG